MEWAIRGFFSLLDRAIYSVVETLMQLIIDLANLQLFSNSTITQFANRIYIILGLVMFFKITISFIQILINPDKMNDKEQGLGNILKRVAISMVLIVFVPSIFRLARQVQSYVIPIIPRVLLGVTVDPNQDDPNTQERMNATARMMAFYSFLPFFTYDNESCNHGEILGSSSYGSNNEIWSVWTAIDHVYDQDSCSTNSNHYKYYYGYGLSTVVGAYLIFVLVSVSIAIAIRAIKLAICEFAAPIPIASYIDPKTSKGAFDSWVNITVKTYLDLFIRLIIVYFVVFVFQTIFDSDNLATMFANIEGGFWSKRGLLITLFIIVGLLQFVKQAPKFISDLLGIKDGGGNLMGMFKGEGWKQIGNSLGGLAGTALSAGGVAVGNARYALNNDEKNGKVLTRALGGFFGAARRGAVATVKGEGWKGAYSNNIATTSRISHRRSDSKLIARESLNEYNSSKNIYDSDFDKTKKGIEDKYQEQLKAIGAIKNLSQAEKSKKIEDAITERDTALKQAENSHKQKIASIRPIQPVRDRMRGAISGLQGLSVPTGAAYSNAASKLSGLRSNIFTGEAMKKLREEGSKLDGVLHDYEIGGQHYKFDYSTLQNYLQQVETGKFDGTIKDSKGTVVADKVASNVVKELFSRAEKNGAVDYINAALTNNIRNDKDEIVHINNVTMTEIDKQVPGLIAGLEIDANAKQYLQSLYNADVGQFYKELSDISKQYETIGTRRSAYEQSQNESKNG